MKNRVLLISQYFLPDISAASFRINDLYIALQKQGFDVTVITTNPQKAAVEEVRQNERIHRLQLEKINKKSFINYIRNYFGFMFKSVFYSLFRLRKKKFDYVIVTSPPLFVALGGAAVAFFKHAKLIVDIRDIWPDSAVSAGMLQREGLLYAATKKMERLIYKRADIITCVSRPMSEYIYGESGHERIEILYNGISPESITDAPSTAAKKTNSKITVGYAGNIGIVQNLGIILDAAKHLEHDFEFLIIGDGIERTRLHAEMNDTGVKNVTFTGALSKQEAMARLGETDLLFFSLIEDPVFEKTIPSKLFDYLLSNKPIVTSIQGEGREILTELGCALFFDPNDAASLASALETYKNNQKVYDEKAAGNRKYVTKHYNREEIFTNFLEKL